MLKSHQRIVPVHRHSQGTTRVHIYEKTSGSTAARKLRECAKTGASVTVPGAILPEYHPLNAEITPFGRCQYPFLPATEDMNKDHPVITA